MQINFDGNTYGKTKLIGWSPDRLIQNFGQLAFFKSIIFCFLKEKEKKHNKLIQTYINNQNQEAFIVIIIIVIYRYYRVCYAKYYVLKNTDPKNQIILFLFC